LRQGETQTLKIEIGTMPDNGVQVALADKQSNNDSTPRLGVYLAQLTPEARQRFNVGKDAKGVLVAGVQPGSPAAEAGIEPGEVISMVNQESVNTPDDVISKVKQAASEKKSSVLLMVEKDGMQQFVAVKFAKA